MLELLNRIVSAYGEYTKMNPVIAGAMSLWVLGTLTYMCRAVPASLWSFTKKEFTTTITMNNETRGYNHEHFMGFINWFSAQKWSKYSRSMSIDVDYETKKNNGYMAIGIGLGHHFFFYKGRLFILYRWTSQNPGMSQIMHHVDLTMLGRNKQVMYDLVEDFRHKISDDRSRVYKFNKEWISYADVAKRPMRTVIIDRSVKEDLISIIDEFKKNEAWYVSRGLPYKKTFIFHGVPGTGKTSIIKALACHYNKNIAILNLQMMTDETLEHAIATLPKGCILAIEDFDATKATKRRDRLATKTETSGNMEIEMITLSGILNALDGVVGMDDTLTFLTTNVLDDIDPAIYRKGRVDYIYEIKALRHTEVLDYIELMFPGSKVPEDMVFNDILGCDLQAIYFDNHGDFMSFIGSIPWTPVTVEQKNLPLITTA